MHDFCVLPVHSSLLALGGIIAYTYKDSKVSLADLEHCFFPPQGSSSRDLMYAAAWCEPSAAPATVSSSTGVLQHSAGRAQTGAVVLASQHSPQHSPSDANSSPHLSPIGGPGQVLSMNNSCPIPLCSRLWCMLCSAPQASLYGGLGTAAILAACTQLSYKQFKEKKPVSQPVTAVSLGVSAAVTAGMLHNCKAIGENNKLAIAGAVLSTAFTGGQLLNGGVGACRGCKGMSRQTVCKLTGSHHQYSLPVLLEQCSAQSAQVGHVVG